MTATRGRILVIRGGAIGDFILTLPVLSALRASFPQVSLEVLGYPRVAELARGAGIIDAYHPIESRALASFFARNGRLDERVCDYFATCDLIISYLYDPDQFFQSNVARATKAQFIQGLHRPDEALDTHATKVFLKPLEKLAIFDPDPVPRLNIEAETGVLSGGAWLAVHPGSGSPLKNWARENWIELLKNVMARSDWTLLLVGGEAEGDWLRELPRSLPPERVSLGQNLPLLTLARRLARCRLFLGHDSGITHLACAIGLPIRALWGPTKQSIWRPLGKQVRLITHPDGLDAITPEQVSQSIFEK